MTDNIYDDITLHLSAPDDLMPHRANPTDAGLDLRAAEGGTIPVGKRAMIGTGLYAAIPDGYHGKIEDRSGHAAKSGVTTLAGVIDSGYRGEIKAVLLNTGDKPFVYEKGERIAQMVIRRHENPTIVTHDTPDGLPAPSDQRDGFGSTGTK